MSPCPFCGCKIMGMSQGLDGRNFSVVCTGCGADGPSAPDRETAERLWDRRPEVDFWKKLAAYLGSVHAANADEYEAKSVSKSRRDRQINILTSVAEALLDGITPNGANIGIYSIDDRVKAAGSRAYNAAERLQKL
jgi:Lar family restriction alleviation protein